MTTKDRTNDDWIFSSISSFFSGFSFSFPGKQNALFNRETKFSISSLIFVSDICKIQLRMTLPKSGPCFELPVFPFPPENKRITIIILFIIQVLKQNRMREGWISLECLSFKISLSCSVEMKT